MKIEYQKITNLLDTTSDNVPRFIPKKCIEVHDQSRDAEDRYKPSKQIRFKTLMLRSDLCDCSDAYIVVKGDITLTKAANENFIDVRNSLLAFKNNPPCTDCILKINGALIDNAENLDVIMLMYNLLEYSKNYRKTTGSLWNFYSDEPNDFSANNYNANPITNSESFKYKTSITGKISNANQENYENTEQGNIKTRENLDIVVLLKHLSNLLRTLDMSLINCEINLVLTWYENCVLTDIITQAANPHADPAIPAITDTKLYLPVVTLSIEDDNKFLEQLKSIFKRTTKWNKNRSEMSN